MIDIQDIHFSYNKKEKLFNGFSLKIPEGSIFGLLGPNGSGKTTLMRLVLDLIHLQQGKILIHGESNHRKNFRIRQKTGVLIESPSMYGHLSGNENLALYSRIYNTKKDRIPEVLRLVGLEKAADKKFKRYSLGMKQRLAIASTLLHNPPLIMLDEPMNGLDPQGMHDIRELIIKLNRDEGKTIFISSHILSEIESTCTNIGIIKEGHCIFSGKTEELKNQMRSSRRLVIKTNEAESAFEKLKTNYNTELKEDKIIINMNKDQKNAELIKTIILMGIPVDEAYNQTNNLESLFLELTK